MTLSRSGRLVPSLTLTLLCLRVHQALTRDPQQQPISQSYLTDRASIHSRPTVRSYHGGRIDIDQTGYRQQQRAPGTVVAIV